MSESVSLEGKAGRDGLFIRLKVEMKKNMPTSGVEQ